MKPFAPAMPDHVRRTNTTAAAFLVGLPLAVVVLGGIHFGPLRHTTVFRYVEHPVECVEVILFCCAMAALGAKLWHSLAERRACNTQIIPPWDGKPVDVAEATGLLDGLNRLPWPLRNTFLTQRVANVLDFLCQRRSAAELDDQLRSLADVDAVALEGSYALTRFITWAIPILGFLGTVLGITGAIAGVKSESLDMSSVTGGLAYAFDATALGLALTMVTMFASFLVERQEQAVLDAVDRYIERTLAHRFERLRGDVAPFVDAVRQNSQVLLDATQQLVQRQLEATQQLAQRQADVWSKAFAEAERHTSEQQSRVAGALELALERTLTTHGERLAALEKQALDQGTGLFEQLAGLAGAVRDAGREQQASLTGVGEAVAAQAAVLGKLQEGEANLVRLQTLLQQNLAALAGAGSFDQAVHTLAAAVHLLTARTGKLAVARAEEANVQPSSDTPSGALPRPQPGKAA